jgi:hypothetical protein
MLTVVVEGGSRSKASGEDASVSERGSGTCARRRGSRRRSSPQGRATAKTISMLERGERKTSLPPHRQIPRRRAGALRRGARRPHRGNTQARRRCPGPRRGRSTHSFALPVSLTPLLGREREVEEIVGPARPGAAVRLLTLTGPGVSARPAWASKRHEAGGYFPTAWPSSPWRPWATRRS